MLTKQEMYAFPTACREIFGESVSHSTFYAQLVALARQNYVPPSVMFNEYCTMSHNETIGYEAEWDDIIIKAFVKPLEDNGFILDSYNYEIFMQFLYDYVMVTLEKGEK